MALPVTFDHCVIHVDEWQRSNRFYAEVIGADEGADAGEGFGEAVRIAEAGVEEALLANERACRRDVEAERDDAGGGLEGFEVRVQRAEKNLGIGRGLGEAEAVRVGGVVGKAERERELGGDELGGG